MKRTLRFALTLSLVFALAIILVGCSSSSSKDDAENVSTTIPSMKIGTLQTDDLLPLWVAEDEGLLKDAGLDVEIITFQSAQEQVAAVTAGEVDGVMTDMVVPVQLIEGGTSMKAVSVMQGAPAGILASPKSKIGNLQDLAGVPAGCSSPTILEFIYEKALTDAGVKKDDIKIEEIKKLPVRLEMLTSNQIEAAVLPWTLFSLAQQQGAKPLAGVEQTGPYTSTVLEFRDEFLNQPNADEAIALLLEQWQVAVNEINTTPDNYRELLVEKAKLPEPLKETYKVRTYPDTELPAKEQFEEVVEWMVERGYIEKVIPYEELVYSPVN